MKSLNIKEIQEIIPHRHPFLLLDAIEDYEPGEYAVGSLKSGENCLFRRHSEMSFQRHGGSGR